MVKVTNWSCEMFLFGGQKDPSQVTTPPGNCDSGSNYQGVVCDNGVIHQINEVLIPYEGNIPPKITHIGAGDLDGSKVHSLDSDTERPGVHDHCFTPNPTSPVLFLSPALQRRCKRVFTAVRPGPGSPSGTPARTSLSSTPSRSVRTGSRRATGLRATKRTRRAAKVTWRPRSE